MISVVADVYIGRERLFTIPFKSAGGSMVKTVPGVRENSVTLSDPSSLSVIIPLPCLGIIAKISLFVTDKV
jgi:hypothetical protein